MPHLESRAPNRAEAKLLPDLDDTVVLRGCYTRQSFAPHSHPAYVLAGRDAQDLARKFEPSAQAIRNWVADADRRNGRREPKPAAVDVALTSTERDELSRLRRENKRLRLERDILSRAAAWFARETGVVPPGSSHS